MKLGLYICLSDIMLIERCGKSTAQKRLNEARKKLQIPLIGVRSLKNHKIKTSDYFKIMGISKDDLILFLPIS
jgi:hypothetical protein